MFAAEKLRSEEEAVGLGSEYSLKAEERGLRRRGPAMLGIPHSSPKRSLDVPQ